MQEARSPPQEGCGDEKRGRIAGLPISGRQVFAADCTTQWEKINLAAIGVDPASEEQDDDQEDNQQQQSEERTAPGYTMQDVTPDHQVIGELSGRPLPADKVAQGRMHELIRMNDHHVMDEVPEGEAQGRKIETSRWVEDFKPKPDDPKNVRSRCVVHQYRYPHQDGVHQGTHPLFFLRLIVSLAASRGQNRLLGMWDAVVAFFHASMPDDEPTYVRPPHGLRRKGFVWFLRRALCGTRRASILFGQLLTTS